ncbi:MAG: hypothetical protein KAU17_07155 [Spirochaetales bacterium]|nr:hypothetical protein [Spirochaetales bacterium]
MKSIKVFLEDSPIAEKVRLESRVITHRRVLSPRDLVNKSDGEYIASSDEVCELEVGGQILAKGKIVRKRGVYFFKVLESSISIKQMEAE